METVGAAYKLTRGPI